MQKNVRLCWQEEQKEAFQEVKRLLTSDRVLAHYDTSLRRLSIRCGSRSVAWLSEWRGEADSICVALVGSLSKEVFSIGEGRFGYCVWGQKVPPVSLWPADYHPLRPQTPSVNFQGNHRNTSIGIGSYTAMGSPVRSLRLHYIVQTW